MSISSSQRVRIPLALLFFFGTVHTVFGGTLPEVPDPEAIYAEQIKKLEDWAQRCTQSGTKELESAPDKIALEARMKAQSSECTNLDTVQENFAGWKAVRQHFDQFNSQLNALSMPERSKLGDELGELYARKDKAYLKYVLEQSTLSEDFDKKARAVVSTAKTQLLAAYQKQLPALAAETATTDKLISDMNDDLKKAGSVEHYLAGCQLRLFHGIASLRDNLHYSLPEMLKGQVFRDHDIAILDGELAFIQREKVSAAYMREMEKKLPELERYGKELRKTLTKVGEMREAIEESNRNRSSFNYSPWSEKVFTCGYFVSLKIEEARRVIDERLKAEKALEEGSRVAVSNLIAKDPFKKMQALITEEASIAAQNATAKMGFKEWTIGSDQPAGMTSCTPFFKSKLPHLYIAKSPNMILSEEGEAKALAGEALNIFSDDLQLCIVSSTAFEKPVELRLGYAKGKLAFGMYSVDGIPQSVLIDALTNRYGKAVRTETTRSKGDMEKDMLKKAESECLKGISAQVGEAVAIISGASNYCLKMKKLGIAAVMESVPARGETTVYYDWIVGKAQINAKYSEALEKTGIFNGKPSEWEVTFASSNTGIKQLTNATIQLGNDTVRTIMTNRETARNKRLIKDF